MSFQVVRCCESFQTFHAPEKIKNENLERQLKINFFANNCNETKFDVAKRNLFLINFARFRIFIKTCCSKEFLRHRIAQLICLTTISKFLFCSLDFNRNEHVQLTCKAAPVGGKNLLAIVLFIRSFRSHLGVGPKMLFQVA